MNLKKVETKEKNIVELEVQVEHEQFNAAIEKAYHRNAGKINVPGFRKGKAPRKIIEKMYGPSVFFEDAVSIAYPDAYREAVEASGIDPVDQADVDIVEISPEGFTFTAKVTVSPEVTLGNYKGLSAPKEIPVVSDAEVDMEIDRLKKRNSRISPVERPVQNGDTAVIDFEGFVDGAAFDGGKGENHNLVIGSGQFIPGFEEQLIGVSAGESKDVEVTFPEDYNSPELAGKKATFKCSVNEVKETIEPEVDDEFAKDVSEFDTLAQLKDSIREKIMETTVQRVDGEFEEALLDKLLEEFQAEIPAVMVESQIDRLIDDMNYRLSMQGIDFDTYMKITGSTPEKMRESLRERAEHQVKVNLALAKIGQLEKMEITGQQIDEEYEKLSQRYNMPVEKIKTMLTADSLKKDLVTERALEIIKESATAIEVSSSEASAKEKSDSPKKAKAAPAEKKTKEKSAKDDKEAKPAKATKKKPASDEASK